MDRFQLLGDALNGRCPGLELLWGEAMSRHTTFRIGGPARCFALPSTEEELLACLEEAGKLDLPLVVVGNGSNLLVDDGGVEALVVSTLRLTGMSQAGPEILEVQAGATLARLSTWAAGLGLTGLEFAHGIPGTLGGAVLMNAGAYGGEMAQVVTSVRTAGPDGLVHTWTGEELAFGYRRSRFSGGKEIILSARLELRPGDTEKIREEMAHLDGQRREKQPLEYPSAGSMFKRPAGHFAAALIDQCGLKGFSVGDAQVSEKHAGFVINRGQATCAQVMELVEQVRLRVREQTGVDLEMEVRRLP